MKTFIVAICSILIGMITGIGFLVLIPNLPLPVNNFSNSTFGIKKTIILGFQPYWLLEKASSDYHSRITTLTYFGLSLHSDGTIVKLTTPIQEDPGWTTLRSKKLQSKLQDALKYHENTSLLIADSDEVSISQLLSNPKQHAKNLINDVTPLLQKYHFSDLNIDIESFQEASTSSKNAYTTFIREVKNGLQQNALGTLTIEISPSTLVKNFIIDPESTGRIADFIVLMAYDYHYIGSYITGPIAPLNGEGKKWDFDVATAMEAATKVIPANKIILGIPLYGYEWETLNNTTGSPIIPHTASTASSRRVNELLTHCQNCIKLRDNLSEEPILIYPDAKINDFHQIYYEDSTSLQRKLDLAKKYDLAGVALWALGYDSTTMLQPLESYKKNSEWIK